LQKGSFIRIVRKLSSPRSPETLSVPPREQAQSEVESAQRISRDENSSPPGGDRAGYLAFVAHEMRNPLSTALWSAELLGRLSPEDRAGPRGEKLTGMCLRTLARLRHLVEDHFLAERLAIRGIPVRVEMVPLGDAVAAASGRVPAVQCECEIDGAMTVAADRAMLERTLEALIALCGREGAPVRVTAEPVGGSVEVKVRGAVPPPEALDVPGRSTPSDPTGRVLGPLMARAVAEVHGGALELLPDGYLLAMPLEDVQATSGDDR
jgi:signal transduction histidine kinase